MSLTPPLRMTQRLPRWLAVLGACALPLLAQAQSNCPTGDNTDANYILGMAGSEASAMHWPTGLVWKRCVEGMTFDGSQCTGTAQTKTWNAWAGTDRLLPKSFTNQTNWGISDFSQNLLESGAWRMAYVNELQKITENCGNTPKVNRTVFPNTPSLNVWSGSPYANYSYYAWSVGFGNGYPYDVNRSFDFHVRLVRGGQSFAPLTSSSAQTVGAGAAVTFGAFTLAPSVAPGEAWGGARITGDGDPEFDINASDTWVKEAIVKSGDAIRVRFTAPATDSRTVTFTLRSGQTTGTLDDASNAGTEATAMQETTASFTANVQPVIAYSAAPTATTNAASAISANAATLNATVNDNGAATSVSFDWGTSISYGNSASATPATVNAGAGSTAVTGSLSGLACNTVYHYRVNATSSEGTTQGSDVSFTTGPCVPGAPTAVTAMAGNTEVSVSFTAPASNGGSAITSYTVTSNPGGLTGTGAASPITVSGLTNGTAYTFTVTATNSAGTGTASAASNSVTPKAPQYIDFSNPGTQNFGTSPTLTATATSGLTPTFSSSTTGVCTITSGGVLTFVTAGTCTINANQAGDASYLPATEVSRSFTVNPVLPGTPTIGTATAGDTQASVAFTAPTNTGGTTITGYTVTVSPPHVSPVNGANSPIVVTGLTNGQAYTFTVTATNPAGTGPASVASNSITPAAIQTITFSNPGAQNFGTSPTLSASSDSGLIVSFTSSTTGVCTITSGGVLTFVTAGTCTINADQAGNASYLPAPQVSQTFSVNAVVPSVPNIGPTTAGDTLAIVNWTAPASNGGAVITGYRVQVATSESGVYADAEGDCAFTSAGISTAVICTATGLTNGTEYFFKVAAINSVGMGSYSSASSGVTPVASLINGACGGSHLGTFTSAPTTDLCNAGTADSVTGSGPWNWTCSGSGGGSNASCSANVQTHAVTADASPAAGGTASCAPSPVPHGGNTTCTAVANTGSGYAFQQWTGACAGQGAQCTLSNVQADQASTAVFGYQIIVPEGPQTGEPVELTPPTENNWQITAASTATTDSVGTPPPANVSLPHGVVSLQLEMGTAGSSATVVLTYPEPLPAGTRYYKFGRTQANPTPHWYVFSGAVISGNTITLTLTDGGAGDDDLTANGVIVDPGGPALAAGDVAAIPTLSEWAMMLLAGIIGLLAFGHLNPRRHPA